jgi:hypothetical protein
MAVWQEGWMLEGRGSEVKWKKKERRSIRPSRLRNGHIQILDLISLALIIIGNFQFPLYENKCFFSAQIFINPAPPYLTLFRSAYSVAVDSWAHEWIYFLYHEAAWTQVRYLGWSFSGWALASQRQCRSYWPNVDQDGKLWRCVELYLNASFVASSRESLMYLNSGLPSISRCPDGQVGCFQAERLSKNFSRSNKYLAWERAPIWLRSLLCIP